MMNGLRLVTTMPNELKPCPFCGGIPRIIENKLNLNKILYGVYCVDEHHEVSVGYFDSEEEATEAWNRRADNGNER